MKWKRLLSGALGVALALTVSAPAASAASTTFPDIQDHWAKSYIEAMTTAGMFKGYDDGNFKPENLLTTAEALALCARAVGLDTGTISDIAQDYYDEVDDILDGEQSWFYQEFSICLATGILTSSDLQSLVRSGDLSEPIAKEDLAVYLVRAMQLGPMSERLTSYPLSFDDTSSIDQDARPSVYLLNIYGIVEGDEFNDFSPKLNVNRAVMSTMLTRSLAYMQSHGTSPDLPEYTDYDFQQGVIASTPTESGSTIRLTLENDLTGATMASITLPDDVTIYENNMESSISALKTGRHARVCLDRNGTPFAVRVSDSLETFTADINGIDGYNVAVTVDGEGRLLTMDRFTQVQVNNKTVGDRDIVDASADYTTATCKLDDQGRLVAIQFTGGFHLEEGLLAGYTRGASASSDSTIQLTGFNGVTRNYTIPSDATITVDGASGSLSSRMEGNYVSLRLSDDDNSITAVSVDTETEYVQGTIRAVDDDDETITVDHLNSGRRTEYDVLSSAVITYEDETTRLRNLDRNDFVTLQLNDDDEVTMIQSYPSSSTTEGILTDRVFGTGSDTTVTFVVTQDDDTMVSFKVDLSDPPTVERDDEDSSVDKLSIGDEVEVTVRNGEVTRITALTQSVNVTGTVDRIIQESSGYTLEMTLSDGEEVSYSVSSGVSVTQNGRDVNLSDLRPGYKLGLAVNGEHVTAIEVQQAVNSSNKLSGTVLYVDSGEDYLYLRAVTDTGGEEMVTVRIRHGSDSPTVILNASTGETMDAWELDSGYSVEVTGSYDGSEFVATIILCY